MAAAPVDNAGGWRRLVASGRRVGELLVGLEPERLASVLSAVDVDELTRELRDLRLAHAMTCQAYGELLGAAWAALAAVDAGTPDPLWRLRDELAVHPCTSHTSTPPGAGDPAASSVYGPVLAPALAPRRAAA